LAIESGNAPYRCVDKSTFFGYVDISKAGAELPHSKMSGFGGEIFGEGVVGALGVPEDADDPPAFAVVEELDAVDAAREGCFAGGVAGFVAAEDLRDVAVGFDAVDDRAFEETILEEIATRALGVVVDGVGADADGAVGRDAGGSEVRGGNEQGTETIPVAFAGRAGDDVVEGGHEAVDGFDVFGFGGGGAGEGIRGGLLRRRRRGLRGGGFVGGGLGGSGSCARDGKSCGEN